MLHVRRALLLCNPILNQLLCARLRSSAFFLFWRADEQTSGRADKQTSRQADKRKFWERVLFVVFVSLSLRRFVVFVEKKTQNNLLRDQIFTIFVKRIYYGQQQVIEDKLEHQLPKIAMLQEECNNLRPNIPLLHTLYQPQR